MSVLTSQRSTRTLDDMRITNDCVVIWITGSEPGPQAFQVDPDLEDGEVEIPFPDVNLHIQRKSTRPLSQLELFDLANHMMEV